jgi:Zn-dependent alcohol dehydrogenase
MERGSCYWCNKIEGCTCSQEIERDYQEKKQKKSNNMENKEKYYDCYVDSETYSQLKEVPAFLTVPFYPNMDFAISGEVGKIGIGYRTFLRFFFKDV